MRRVLLSLPVAAVALAALSGPAAAQAFYPTEAPSYAAPYEGVQYAPGWREQEEWRRHEEWRRREHWRHEQWRRAEWARAHGYYAPPPPPYGRW